MANYRTLVATVALLTTVAAVSPAAQNAASLVAMAPPPRAAARVIKQDSVWTGTVSVNGKIQVLAGATLTIRPGTNVLFAVSASRRDSGEDRIYVQAGGTLIARGTESEPIVFSSGTAGTKWFGIEIHSGHDRDSFAYCRIRDSRMGIACVNSSPTIEHCVFEDNQGGVSMWRQSKPLIRNCRFLRNEGAIRAGTQSAPTVTSCEIEESGAVGVSIENDSGGTVEKTRLIRNKVGISKRGTGNFRMEMNRFESNEVGVSVDHEGASAELASNAFTDNRQGVRVTAKATPRITRNSFQKNSTAIRFESRSKGSVSGNDFTANRSGIELSRTSSPEITRNRFSKNDTALLCEYSSYPTISENNFDGNATDIHAGDNQSFEWTRRVWPAGEWEQWGDRYGRNRIVARNNYWGEETTRRMQAGTKPIESFFDYQRSREIRVNDKSYRRDEIDYLPFNPKPIKDAGTGEQWVGDSAP